MRTTIALSTAGIFALCAMGLAVSPASAACKRMGFLVNDYGKEGPARDAKALLDKSIAKEMSAQGIKTYKIGEKSVKCELFLNFIVFDEHTCTASANVCWDGTPLPNSEQAEANGAPAVTQAANKTDNTDNTAAKKSEKPTTTGSIDNSADAKSGDDKPQKKSSAVKSEAKAKDKTSSAESAATSKTEPADPDTRRAEGKAVTSTSSREERYESVPVDTPSGKTTN